MKFRGLKKFWFKLTNWESWHYHIKYIPIAPVWLWYCIKARSFWFFTASNPTITFGGFEGEGKQEIYNQLPTDSYPSSLYVDKILSFEKIKEEISKKNFSFPLVGKPDVGLMGYLFRKLDSEEQLKKYHEFMPVNYIIQKWIDYPIELSIFYCRMPQSIKGKITGMLMKKPPEVTGDGVSTLSELVAANEILKLNYETISLRHQKRMQMVLPLGKRFVISDASNRSQGGFLINLDHEIDEKLLNVFDNISLHSKSFFYGRFDVKCESLQALKNGEGFSILEYNGAGAGVQHVYGNNLSLFEACTTIVHHWKMLYEISEYNHLNKNIPYWNYRRGRRFLNNAMQNIRRLKMLDETFPAMN